MSYDDAVRAWYADPTRFHSDPNGDPIYKAIDHAMLDRYGVAGKDVLDLGCFYPETELVYAERAKSWTAIDFTPEVIERARAIYAWPTSVAFRCEDMRALTLADAQFDIALDFSSGDHLVWPDWLRAVAEVRRVLRSGGVFICSYSNLNHHPDGREEVTDSFGFERRTDPDALHASLANAGLRIAYWDVSYPRSIVAAVKP